MVRKSYVLGFQEINKTKFALVGGKGGNLGELFKIKGLQVPEGFCITTEAFKKIIEGEPLVEKLIDQLSVLKVKDRYKISELNKISELSAKIRKVIEQISLPEDIKNEITRHVEKLGAKNSYAVRSSATKEDLTLTSFAGQHDTYLNIIGEEDILKYVSKCWASLFTERAIIYRLQNSIDQHKVHLAVVVQKMVFSDVAGVMFTADPVTSNRKILSIEASFGLGEALVYGIVNADNYKVMECKIVDKKISHKKLAVYALKEGGTKEYEIELERQTSQTLTNEQILQLEQIGRTIESHFGCPQDIEWCLMDNKFYIVQSRPVTTLYPIPEVDDKKKHVYISFGHQQMMIDAMKPLGIALWQLTSARPMFKAGGRLFIDVTEDLMTSRKSLLELLDQLGQHDVLIKNALTTLIEQEDSIKV